MLLHCRQLLLLPKATLPWPPMRQKLSKWISHDCFVQVSWMTTQYSDSWSLRSHIVQFKESLNTFLSSLLYSYLRHFPLVSCNRVSMPLLWESCLGILTLILLSLLERYTQRTSLTNLMGLLGHFHSHYPILSSL